MKLWNRKGRSDYRVDEKERSTRSTGVSVERIKCEGGLVWGER